MMGKSENVNIPEHFLNMDVSLNIALRCFRFCTCILEKNVDICPGLYFIKCRNLGYKITQKVTRFLV